MYFNKINGKLMNVKFSKAEEKIIDEEIQKMLADYLKKLYMEVDAMVLDTLMETSGFGKKSCRKFYDAFIEQYDALVKRYEMNDSEISWVYTMRLKEKGIDLEEWENDSRRFRD